MQFYYPISGHVLRLNELDSKKIIFHHYLIRRENLQRLNGNLPRGYFELTLRNAANYLKFSMSTVHRMIKEFESLNIIKCIKKSTNSSEASIYEYIFDYNYETVNETVHESVDEDVKSSDINELSEEDKDNTDTENETVDKTFKKELIKNNNIYSLVIDKLNEKANTRFKPTTQKTKSLINARLKEKFTLEDFYKVIDIKCEQWKGSHMEVYLRPNTLFSNKFESYLNEYRLKYENENNNNLSPWNPEFHYE